MTDQEILDLAGDLETLLSEERALLLAGRAREAADLNSRKLSALTAIETVLANERPARPSPHLVQAIEGVVRMSRENSQLLAAVRNGLRSLIDRFEKPPEAAFVGCYRPGGSAMAFTKATGGYQKKI